MKFIKLILGVFVIGVLDFIEIVERQCLYIVGVFLWMICVQVRVDKVLVFSCVMVVGMEVGVLVFFKMKGEQSMGWFCL